MKSFRLKLVAAVIAVGVMGGGSYATSRGGRRSPSQAGQFLTGVGLTKLSALSSTHVEPGSRVTASFQKQMSEPGDYSNEKLVFEYRDGNSVTHPVEVDKFSGKFNVPMDWTKGTYKLVRIEHYRDQMNPRSSIQFRDGKSIAIQNYSYQQDGKTVFPMPSYGNLKLQMSKLDLVVA